MSDSNYQRWICDACGYIYDEAKGDPDSGLVAGTRYEDIPDDWECPLCGMKKSDLRLLPEQATSSETSITNTRRDSSRQKGGHDYIVIVGAGIAGWAAAEAIRRRQPDRPVLLVSACKGAVYSKPSLSLAISRGRQADELIESDATTRAAELGIEVQPHTRVLRIDTDRKRLVTTRGGIAYDKLILAMGAQQRQLLVDGDAADKILRVNDLSSFKQLQARLAEGVNSIMILGAGLIGCEFADDFNRAGYKVTVTDPQTQPLANLVPGLMAYELRQRLAAKGVNWHLGSTLESLDERGDGTLIARLSDGSVHIIDVVLSAAGLVVNTDLAKKAGLHVDKGVAVDRNMLTSSEHIYALGDCASVEGQLFAFIEPILRQAEAIAANLAGEDEPFMPIPPMVKIKTQSMPISICRPTNRNDEQAAWKMVSNGRGGSHFEMLQTSSLVGFALSGSLAGEAGQHYQKLTA